MKPEYRSGLRRVDHLAVVKALQAYCAEKNAGKTPCRLTLLAQFPEISVELTACLNALAFLELALAQL